MDKREYMKMQLERARDHVAKRLDKIVDDIEDNNRRLSKSDCDEIKELLDILHRANEMMK